MTLTPPMQDVQGPDMITMVHKMTMGLRSTRKSRMEANMFVGRMKVHLFVGIVDGQVYFETTKEVSASQYCATFGLVIHSTGEIRNSMGWASYSIFLKKTQETLETEILSSRVSYFGSIVFSPETLIFLLFSRHFHREHRFSLRFLCNLPKTSIFIPFS